MAGGCTQVLIPDRGIVSGSCPSADGHVALFYGNEANLGVPEMLRARGFGVYHGRYDDAEQAARFKVRGRVSFVGLFSSN